MMLGIMHPPDMEGPVRVCSRLYFTDEFLHNPPAMWEVEPVLGDQSPDSRHWTGVPPQSRFAEGSVVKCGYAASPTVWVLTGRDFPLTQCHVFEGEWPD
jgi:hypothetical protein